MAVNAALGRFGGRGFVTSLSRGIGFRLGQSGGVLFFYFFFLVTFFFWERGGGGWVEAIPVTVVTLGPLDPLAI